MYRPAHCGQSPNTGCVDATVALSGDSNSGERQENGLPGPRVLNDGFLFRTPARCRSAKSHLCDSRGLTAIARVMTDTPRTYETMALAKAHRRWIVGRKTDRKLEWVWQP